MERPGSIVWFERCYLGAFVVGLVNTALLWQSHVTRLSGDPAAAALGSATMPTVLVLGIVVGVAVMLSLWYFAARRAAAWAKWVITVLFVLSALSLLHNGVTGTFSTGLPGVLGIVGLVLQAIAVWQLFTPASRAWFGEGRVRDASAPSEIDPL